VGFDGNKGGNVPYTLAWNAAMTQLTVSLTTGPSGLYHVQIIDIDNDTFKDANGQKAAMGVCKTMSLLLRNTLLFLLGVVLL